MDNATDLLLVRRAREGDRSACEQLVRAHYQAIYQYLARSTFDPHRAADLTQETFASAWRQLGGFRGEARFSSWLHRIARGKLIDDYRKTQRRAEAHARLHAEFDTKAWGTSDAVREEQRDLYEALGRLGEDDRQMLVLRYLQGMTFAETAVVLDEPVGTIKWRARRALERLKHILTREGDPCDATKSP